MSKYVAEPHHTVSSVVIPVMAQMRDHVAQLPSPELMAQDVLEDFVQRFDQTCAMLVKSDESQDGAWHRAFQSVNLQEDVGVTRLDAVKFVMAMAYGQMLNPDALQPLRAWRKDWHTILCDMEALPLPEVQAQQRKHMSTLYNLSFL